MPIPNLERGFPSTAVWTCVVDKLDNGKQFCPIVLLEVSADTQVLLDFLVYSFRFSIGLWVESSRQFLSNPEFSPEFLCYLCRELWSSIRNNGFWKPDSFPYIIHE